MAETLSTKDESLIWEGSQSQILNLDNFIAAVIVMIIITAVSLLFVPPPFNLFMMALNIIPLIYIVYKFMLVRSIKYKITSQRVLCITGIFSKKTDSIELYRIKDLELFQPFWMRMFGYGSITLITYDTSDPTFLIKAVPSPAELFDKLRMAVEKRRDEKRFRGVEIDSDTLNL